jgi:CRISPR system Cascade subunit CasE
MTLHMVELRLDPEALIRFAQDQRVNRNRDEDLGYALHIWLKALLQEKAPKPFRLVQHKNGIIRLLGYSLFDGSTLLNQAQTFARPLTTGVTRIDDLLHAKPMPDKWLEGRQLGFEILLCPVSRKQGKEKDLFLHRVEATDGPGNVPQREVVYQRWLVAHLSAGATVEQAELRGFRLISQYRQGRKTGGGRGGSRLTRPQALFQGTLCVRDSQRFSQLLARGIGRHRAFGYGMLLLRPVK